MGNLDIKIISEKSVFYAEASFMDAKLLKQLKCIWLPKECKWRIPDAKTAFKLIDKCKCDHKVKEDIILAYQNYEARKRLSDAVYSDFKVEIPEGRRLYPYQKAGVEYMLKTPRVLLADDMGLGKTAQAIALCNMLKPRKVLIVCPASLKINWKREWSMWSTLDIKPIILNYDILKKNTQLIHEDIFDVLILDECHYLKNNKAQRSKEIYGIPRGRGWELLPVRALRVVAITGTPILNRPIELFPILKYLNKDLFPDKFKFGKRYCDGKKNRFGFDFTGHSNLEELQEKLRVNLMVRRMKSEVLTSLPKKVRQIIEIAPDRESAKMLGMQLDLVSDLARIKFKKDLTEKEYRHVVKSMQGVGVKFDGLAELRKLVGVSKLKHGLRLIANALEHSGKVVVFCHHREIAEEIYEHFKESAVLLIGKTTMKNRQKAVDEFQLGDKQLFVGNIQAAGVGLTLTASNHVIFMEPSWSPSDFAQCEDRCCRIGQNKSVLVQHLVLEKSMDYYITKAVVSKQEIIEEAVNSEDLPQEIKDLLI